MNIKLILILFFLIPILVFGKTFDCFLFFNEWEVLEIRLNELYDHVDQFVIVEANESFRGLPKPFNFEKKRELYSKFEDKITYIKVEGHFETDNTWERRAFQLNSLLSGLTECQEDDIIILSDVDEIPNPESIEWFKNNSYELPRALRIRFKQSPCKYPKALSLRQTMYRFFINRCVPKGSPGQPWIGPAIFHYAHFTHFQPEQIRILSRSSCFPIIDSGWHFTSMGGFDRMFEKYENFCDWKNPHPMNYQKFRELVDSYDYVPIDESYPRFVQNNIDYLTDKGLIDKEEAATG